jgi:hypothetical protein
MPRAVSRFSFEVRCDSVRFCNFFRSRDGDVHVLKYAIGQAVDPSVDGERLPLLPSFLNDRSVADIVRLFDEVQFTESVNALSIVVDASEHVVVFLADVADVSQPVVNQAEVMIFAGRLHPAAPVVAANDDVFYLQHCDGEFDNAETVKVAVNNDVGDIAMNEYFPRGDSHDLVRRNSAVRTSDPKEFWVLLLGKVSEKLWIRRGRIFCPFAVVFDQFWEKSHDKPSQNVDVKMRVQLVDRPYASYA